MPVVPFTLDSGLSKISGVVRERENDIVIEYQTKFIGLIRSDIQALSIPFEEIDEVIFTSSIFGSKLRLLLKTLRSGGSFPAPKQGEFELKIAWKNRAQARRFASSVNLAASKYEMLRDDEDDDWV
jgi:hypothetical protein